MRLAAYRTALATGVLVAAAGVALWSVAAALVLTGTAIAGAGLAGLMGLEGGQG